MISSTFVPHPQSCQPHLLKDGTVRIVSGNALGEVLRDETEPFDAIHVGAAAASLPETLLSRLAPGGRMVRGDVFPPCLATCPRPRIRDLKALQCQFAGAAWSPCCLPLADGANGCLSHRHGGVWLAMLVFTIKMGLRRRSFQLAGRTSFRLCRCVQQQHAAWGQGARPWQPFLYTLGCAC